MVSVSVIIPHFNRLELLKRSIKSVEEQSFIDWELIVVDDGSQNESRRGLVEQPLFQTKKGKLYISSKNRGVSYARNQGIQRAQGEWLAFLDSDDQWLEHKLFLQMKFLRDPASEGCKILHGEEIWVRLGKRVNPCRHHQKGGGRQFLPSLQRCVISPSCVIIHRSVFQEVGLFREDFPVCEDYDLWLRICARYQVGYISTPLIIKYGGHEDQLSKKFKAMDYWRLKSLMGIIHSESYEQLSIDEKRECLNTADRKAKILLQGYKKHNNLVHYDEVQFLLNEILKKLSNDK